MKIFFFFKNIFFLFKNSDKDIDEHINEEKRNTDKYEVKLRNAQNKVRHISIFYINLNSII